MRMKEMLKEYQQGRIEKKLYWTMMREKLKVLTEIQEMLLNSTECESVQIRKQDIIQENSAGVKMYYDFSQPVCRAEAELYLASDPESESMEFVSRNLNDDAVVFDIGANVGLYSLNLYRRNRNARFYAFEPLPETFKNLERTVALNEVSDSRITCFNIGFSDRGGYWTFIFRRRVKQHLCSQ
ncbi:MAG: FkbM family methyltransferase [Eubacterium sp.]|nr:FkbM family methyltransferase [Eubacterium sp.]